MPTLWSAATVNAFTTTLNSTIGANDTSITLNSVTGLQYPGLLVIDRVDGNGNLTPGKREYISYTGITSNTLTGCVRNRGGSSSLPHSSGAVIEEVMTIDHWNDFQSIFTTEHTPGGLHVINTATINYTETKNLAVTSIASIAQAAISNATIVVANIGTLNLGGGNISSVNLSRQAIINGNFDVWQRGTTVTNLVSSGFIADRWKWIVTADGGTLPTSIISSQQLLTSGDIPNAFYFYRINPNGAGNSFGVNSYAFLAQNIENGVRSLCGLNNTITVSFYARSSIGSKQLGLSLGESYGTGGSPSATEQIITQAPITLTSSWTKYTATFTTNTLVGKIFGTNNDDYLQLSFFYQWGTSAGNTYVYPSVAAETFGGSGTIDIAQVQLCAGTVALPFQPKSYNDELTACRRYYYRISSVQNYAYYGMGLVNSSTQAYIVITHPVSMRIIPSADFGTASNLQVNGIPLTGTIIDVAGLDCTGISCTVTSGLTTGQGARLLAVASTAGYLGFNAEL